MLGAGVGRGLLDSMNDTDAPVLAALAAHADPADAPVLAALAAHADPADAPGQAASGSRAEPAGPGGIGRGDEVDRLVVVVLDGLGEAGFSAAMEHASLTDWQWRATVDMGTPSLSRPVYHVLLTGAPQSVSGIGNNSHAGRARADDLAARVREAGGTVGWALEGVPWFHDLFGQPGDTYENAWPRAARGETRTEAGSAVGPFRPMAGVLARSPTFAVLHFVGIDHAGHSRGAASEEYRRAAAGAMDAVVALRAAHAASPAGARTVWMIGSDHGHRAEGGHGGPEPEVVRTTWLGLWPSATRADVPPAGAPPASEAPAAATPTGATPTGATPTGATPAAATPAAATPMVPVEVPGVVAADRLAATFAAILRVPPPRMALGEPLPLPDRSVVASPARAARRAAIHETLTLSTRAAHRGVSLRAALIAAALVALLALLGRYKPHSAATPLPALPRRLVATVLPTFGAAAAFLALGPGWTLSAIATHEGFLVRSTGVMAGGAALCFLLARRSTTWRAPLRWVFLASALLPGAAYGVVAGSMGRCRLPDEALLLFPTTGLVPLGVVVGTLVAAGVAALFDRRRGDREPRAAAAARDTAEAHRAGAEW